MPFELTWLADTLRAAGLKVVEQPGWQSRGRGSMGTVRGVLLHHTAGALTGNAPSLNLVQNGRSDLPGPLSQLVLGRDGTFFVVGAGRCNHAGAGNWRGVTTGNSSLIGIEAENAGTGKDPWPAVQLDAYARGVAAILRHIGAGPEMAAGHKEYATPRGRKIDPSFDMNRFREVVAEHMAGKGTIYTAQPAATDPVHDMLRRGETGEDVRLAQAALDRAGFAVALDGDFGPWTERAVKAFQASKGLTADGVIGPQTWAKLLA